MVAIIDLKFFCPASYCIVPEVFGQVEIGNFVTIVEG